MKNINKLLYLFLFAIVAFHCKKEVKTPDTETLPVQGNFTFWTKTDLGFGPIDIYIEGNLIGTISHLHSLGVTCGSGDVNIKKEAGNYFWIAKGRNGGSWTGSILFENGKCKTMELTGDTATPVLPPVPPPPPVSTTITYQNNSFTILVITINGASKLSGPGQSVVFTGTPGANALGQAVTSGKTTTGTQVGLQLSWAINNKFPVAGNSNVDVNVGTEYFYLKVQNNSNQTIIKLLVNYGLQSQTTDNISLVPSSVLYGLGYYKAYTNSNIRAESGTYLWTWPSLNLPFVLNQSKTILVN